MARLLAGGMSDRQVASELFVSVKTVQFHLTHIYAKVGVGFPRRTRRPAQGRHRGLRRDRDVGDPVTV